MAWEHCFVECTPLFAYPSSVGCVVGDIHFLLAKSAQVSRSCVPPRFSHPAQLPRCVVYGGHFWRREIVRLSHRPLRARAREGFSRPSPRRAGQARGATNKSRSLLRLFRATSPSSTRRLVQNRRRLLPRTTQAP